MTFPNWSLLNSHNFLFSAKSNFHISGLFLLAFNYSNDNGHGIGCAAHGENL